MRILTAIAGILLLIGSQPNQAHAHIFSSEHGHNEMYETEEGSVFYGDDERRYEDTRDRRSRQTGEARQRRDSARERRKAQSQSIRNLREQRKQARRSRPRY